MSRITPELSDLMAARDRLTKAIEAAKAREWLLQFAPSSEHLKAQECTVSVRQTHGSACGGSAEGHAYLDRAAKELLVKIGDKALQLANDDIQAALPKGES